MSRASRLSAAEFPAILSSRDSASSSFSIATLASQILPDSLCDLSKTQQNPAFAQNFTSKRAICFSNCHRGHREALGRAKCLSVDARITRVVQEHKYEKLAKKTHVYIIICVYIYILLQSVTYYIYAYIYITFLSLYSISTIGPKNHGSPGTCWAFSLPRSSRRCSMACRVLRKSSQKLGAQTYLRVDMSAPEKDKPWE